MKSFLVTTSLIGVLSLATSLAHAAQPPETVWTPVTRIYVPTGFDTNDDTQIIVHGYLPNLCYKAPRAEVSVAGRTISISMKALLDGRAPEDMPVLCAQMIVPFLEPVSVGPLPEGTYTVIVNGDSDFSSRSEIYVAAAASSSIDNHIYANVEYVERAGRGRKILLKGYNPSDCFEFDRVEYVSNGKDTWSVLPIMKQVKPDCPRKMVPMTIEAQVPKDLRAEEVLLHVRVMNGKSVNSLFKNR